MTAIEQSCVEAVIVANEIEDKKRGYQAEDLLAKARHLLQMMDMGKDALSPISSIEYTLDNQHTKIDLCNLPNSKQIQTKDNTKHNTIGKECNAFVENDDASIVSEYDVTPCNRVDLIHSLTTKAGLPLRIFS